MDIKTVMEKLLQDMGLSRNESKTYLALLKYGRMRLKDVTKTTNLHRQNALDSLGKLQAKGLIGIASEGKRKYYSAVAPTRLKVILEEKERKLDSLLPALLSLEENREKPKIDIFSGREGLKTILDDEISTGKTLNVIQSSQTVESLSGGYLSISRERRWRAGIRMRIIYSKKDEQFGRQTGKYPKTEVRYVNDDFGSTTIDIFGDRSVLVFGPEPTIVRIIDAEVARRFMQFFEMNWKNAKPRISQ